MLKVNDTVRINEDVVTESNTGIFQEELNKMIKEPHYIVQIDTDGICLENGYYFEENQLIKLESAKRKDDVKMDKIYFSKVKEGAKIPSKRIEDAGYDIYACFDEDYMIIPPHKTVMIPTGIASCCSDDYVFVLRERGSNGSKGIAQRAGIIDSGYRNEWFVPLTNTNDVEVVITKDVNNCPKSKYVSLEGNPSSIIYPYTKGIAQALLLPVPKVEVEEIPYDKLKEFKSERGMGALGSSGK